MGKNCYTGTLSIEIGSRVRIPIGQLPSNLISAFRRTAIFANPEFFRRQRMRFSTWDTPRYVCCDELVGDTLVLPRGVLDECLEVARIADSDLKVTDSQPERKQVGVHFTGQLSKEQTKSVDLVSPHEFGLLVAPPGAGKTVMACALIAKRDLKTLILVHTKALLEQWRVSKAEAIRLANAGKLDNVVVATNSKGTVFLRTKKNMDSMDNLSA